MHYFFIGAVILFVISLLIIGTVMDKDDMKDND